MKKEALADLNRTNNVIVINEEINGIQAIQLANKAVMGKSYDPDIQMPHGGVKFDYGVELPFMKTDHPPTIKENTTKKIKKKHQLLELNNEINDDLIYNIPELPENITLPSNLISPFLINIYKNDTKIRENFLISNGFNENLNNPGEIIDFLTDSLITMSENNEIDSSAFSTFLYYKQYYELYFFSSIFLLPQLTSSTFNQYSLTPPSSQLLENYSEKYKEIYTKLYPLPSIYFNHLTEKEKKNIRYEIIYAKAIVLYYQYRENLLLEEEIKRINNIEEKNDDNSEKYNMKSIQTLLDDYIKYHKLNITEEYQLIDETLDEVVVSTIKINKYEKINENLNLIWKNLWKLLSIMYDQDLYTLDDKIRSTDELSSLNDLFELENYFKSIEKKFLTYISKGNQKKFKDDVKIEEIEIEEEDRINDIDNVRGNDIIDNDNEDERDDVDNDQDNEKFFNLNDEKFSIDDLTL